MSLSDRSALVYGFVLINMKKTIAPYANPSNPLAASLSSKQKEQESSETVPTPPPQSSSVAKRTTAAPDRAHGSFPAPLRATREGLLGLLNEFCEPINKAGAAKDLFSCFGVTSELTKRTAAFDKLEKALAGYETQLGNYAAYGWCPPTSLQYATGVDKAVDNLMASCVPVASSGDKASTAADTSKSKKGDASAPVNVSAFYFYWTNCLGDSGRGSDAVPGHAVTHSIADWRYEIASLHFNLAVVYLSCAAYLGFLVGGASHPNYYPNEASLIRSYATTGQTPLLEKECYGYCCTAAYHFDKAASLMRLVLGGGGGPDNIHQHGSTPSESLADTVYKVLAPPVGSSGSATDGAPSGSRDKEMFKSQGAGAVTGGEGGISSAALPHSLDSSESSLSTSGVDKSHVPIDMSLPFLTLMREVMLGQGQEISIAKAITASRENTSVSKMTFTALVGRLMLGAKQIFSNALAIAQKEIVIMKAGFSSFVAAVQTKAVAYEAMAYACQGAYMAVPISSSQRMELHIQATGSGDNSSGGSGGMSAASLIGEDAGANPEDGLWCINKAAELARPLPERALRMGCAPAARIWLTFVIQKYIADTQANMTELHRIGLPKKMSEGPVTLKPALVMAKARAPVINTSEK